MFGRFPNTLKFFKNTPQRVIFSTLLSVFKNVMKGSFSCCIYRKIPVISPPAYKPPSAG